MIVVEYIDGSTDAWPDATGIRHLTQAGAVEITHGPVIALCNWAQVRRVLINPDMEGRDSQRNPPGTSIQVVVVKHEKRTDP